MNPTEEESNVLQTQANSKMIRAESERHARLILPWLKD